MRLSNVSLGVLYMLSSSVVFAFMNGFAKALSERIPSMENVFFRSIVMVLLMLVIYFYNYSRHKPKRHYKKGGWAQLVVRIVMGGLSMVAVFYNIATIPLGTAIAFQQSTALYAVVFGVLFLKERLSVITIVATIIGFIGVIMISNPSLNGLSWLNIIAGICSGLFMAIAFVTLRSLKQHFDNAFLVLAFGVSTAGFGALGMLVPISGVGGFVMPIGIEWLYLFLMGFCGTVAQYFLNFAYMSAPVGIVAPVDYSRIVFSVIAGMILGDLIPNMPTTIGMTLIILSGLLIAMPALLKDLKKLNKK